MERRKLLKIETTSIQRKTEREVKTSEGQH